jgi:hypothetical protein
MDLSSDESRESTAENRSAENTKASELVDNSVETPSRPLQEAIPTPTSSLKRNHPRQRQISGNEIHIRPEEDYRADGLDFFFMGSKRQYRLFLLRINIWPKRRSSKLSPKSRANI